ncbi:hypothetical protein [Halobacillus sp. H74]|uniref:hypothetical protein n=1 Tax=Halobacillus sp. H74 TaxID=3457436 RepID=UPI003FCCBC7C
MTANTTKTGTIASVHTQPIDRNLKNITVTSTPYSNPQSLYSSMVESYKTLYNQENITTEELNEFRSMVERLAADSDKYAEGQFKLRKLKKKVKANQNQKVDQKPETLQDFLINQKIESFINIGSFGRKWVVERLVEEEIKSAPEHEIESQLNEKILLLKEHLFLMKEHDKAEGFMGRLSELDITFESDLLAGKVAEKLLLKDLSDVNTLSDLHRIIDAVRNEVEETGIVDSTFEERTFEQFHQQADDIEK